MELLVTGIFVLLYLGMIIWAWAAICYPYADVKDLCWERLVEYWKWWTDGAP